MILDILTMQIRSCIYTIMTLFGDRQDASDRSRFSRLFVEPTRRSVSPLPDRLFDIGQGPFVARGYFAFPPPGSKVDDQPCPPVALDTNEHDLEQARKHDDSEKCSLRSENVDTTTTEAEQKLIDQRRKRREKEQEMAALGEFEWVRSGGVLRDAYGRTDKVRTGAIRQEIRLQEREKLLTDMWENYERKWRALLAVDDPVSFKEIPWPVPVCPSSVDDLNTEVISDFLLEPLEVRANTVTRRERIRSSLLRWHPDKISTVLGRVVLDDFESVREGVNVVFMSLKRMKEH